MRAQKCIVVWFKWLALVFAYGCIHGAAFAAVPGDEHWDNQFGPVGANNTVFSILVRSNKVYVGGNLTQAGNNNASGIAGFDGTNWFALNKGIAGGLNTTYVFALEQDEKYVYVGGWYTNADNSGAWNIARWDGTNWYSMGGNRQLGGFVTCLKRIGNTLYAGGIFTQTNNSCTCLARWDGTNWNIIPGDFESSLSSINAIETDGVNLFLGGDFNRVNGINSTNVVGWNGTSWFALGSGLRGNSVQTLLYKNGLLYAGGAITNTSGATYTNLAVWNGTSWAGWAVANRVVNHLLTDGTNIYACGEFTTINGLSARGIAKWDGLNWSALGSGIRGFANSIAEVHRMAFDSKGRLLAGGIYSVAGNVGAIGVCGWDGTNWFSLGGKTSKGTGGPIGSVRSLLLVGSNLYAGGIFTEAGDTAANGVAKWDGTNWSALGGGVTATFSSSTSPSTVSALLSLGTDLYVGGNFINAGGLSAKGIARWDGNNWFNAGDADLTVAALAYDGAYLWAGGSFTNIGGVNSPGIAFAIPGGGWNGVGSGVSGGNQTVSALATDPATGDVYIAGNFTSFGPVGALNVARWSWANGWNALGSGVNNTASAIAINNGLVYVGGRFTTAGGSTANRIAVWNGSSWSTLGSGLAGATATASVNAIAVSGSNVFVAGTITNAGSVVTSYIARWNGTSWTSLGSGLLMNPGSPTGSALALVGSDLYVGGTFIWAGDKPSTFIARWNEQKNFYPVPNPKLINTVTLTNRQFRFRVSGTSGERYIIQASSNLTTWSAVLTNSATLYDFAETISSNAPARLFRVVLPP